MKKEERHLELGEVVKHKVMSGTFVVTFFEGRDDRYVGVRSNEGKEYRFYYFEVERVKKG